MLHDVARELKRFDSHLKSKPIASASTIICKRSRRRSSEDRSFFLDGDIPLERASHREIPIPFGFCYLGPFGFCFLGRFRRDGVSCACDESFHPGGSRCGFGGLDSSGQGFEACARCIRFKGKIYSSGVGTLYTLNLTFR